MKKIILFLSALFVLTEVAQAQCPITISPSSPTTCSGVPIVLQASTANSYTWSANAGGANTATVAVSPTVTTSYTVTAFTGTCSATAVVTVNVNPLPTVTVTSTTLCATYATTLTASGANNYTWSTGAQGASIVMSPTTTTQYTVVGEDANGCKNFAVATVTVLPTPTVTVNSDAICSGSTTLTATNNGTTYTWSTNAGSAATPSVQVTPATTTEYTVIVGWAANSCTAQATSTVYVNSSTVTITPPAGTFCTDVAYPFIGNANPGPIISYSWYSTPGTNVNIASPTQSGTNITFYQTGNYVLTLIANNSLGCRDSVLFPLSVSQTPTVNATPIAPIICLGGPGTTLFSTVTPNFGPTTYTWSGTGLIQYANGDSANINPTQSGIYTYTLVGTQNGCISQPTTITATVNPAPTPTLVVSPDTICAGGTTTITSYGMPNTTSYTWTAPSTGGLGTNTGYYTWVTPVYDGSVDTTFSYTTDFYVPGCPAYTTYTTNVVVLPTPKVFPVSDTVDNCNKMGDSLQVTSIPPVSSGVTFTWTPSTGLSATTGSGVFANPVNQTWYYVTPSYQGCIGKTDSILVRIGDTTLADAAAQYYITCIGAPDTLVGYPALTQLNSTYQYYWQPSTGPNAPTPINGSWDTVVVNPIATQIYTLTVLGTCVIKQKTEITVYVNNCLPLVNVDFTENTDTICVHHCIYFQDLTYQNNVMPLFYQWVFTGGVAYGVAGQIEVDPPDTAFVEMTDSSFNNPTIKVCYNINSSLNTNGVFPVQMIVSHGPPGSGVATYTVTHYVKVDAGPISHAGNNVTIALGDSTQLNGLTSTGMAQIVNYTWTPPDSLHCPQPPWNQCATPWAQPSQTTHYYLTVTDKNGCTSTDSMTVFVDLVCYDPFVPTGFSPNDDNKNDALFVRSNCLQNFTFKLFDRWGEKVFETNDLSQGWDGTFRGVPANAGVFVWTLEGFLSNGKEVKKHGCTTLVR